MIILDTNIISEPMRVNPNKSVMNWLDAQVAESLFVTTISLAELFVGIEMLPDGKRKSGLGNKLNDVINHLFAMRILAFDHASAINYAKLMIRASSTGHIITMGDGQIASIAETHHFAVATRDTKPFIAAGLTVINPFDL
jgi:toxin FitB